MEWKEQPIVSFDQCFHQFYINRMTKGSADGDISDSVLSILVNVFGKVFIVEENKKVNLAEFVKDSDLEVEVTCADVKELPNDQFLLAVCFVTETNACEPYQQTAVIFKFDADCRPWLLCKMKLERTIACCHLWKTSKGEMALLLFQTDLQPELYPIHMTEDGSCSFSMDDQLKKELPEYCVGAIPGTVIRLTIFDCDEFRWSVFGTDTGYVYITCLSTLDSQIFGRKRLKFIGPISIAEISSSAHGPGSIRIVLSSTVGPVAVWSFSITRTGAIDATSRVALSASTSRDCVTRGTVAGNCLVVSTYGQHLLVYDLEGSEESPVSTLDPFGTIDIRSPATGVQFIRGHHLCALSSIGLHRLSALDGDSSVFEES